MNKRNIANIIFEEWLNDKDKDYNPFFKIIEVIHGEPPYIPPVDMRTLKDRRKEERDNG